MPKKEDTMVYDKARELARDIAGSQEYTEYKRTKELAMANSTTAGLIKQYHQLQLKAQAAALGGQKDEELMGQLQKMGEILMLNQDASAFLMAEFRLNQMLGDVYKILAEAVDVDLGMLDES